MKLCWTINSTGQMDLQMNKGVFLMVIDEILRMTYAVLVAASSRNRALWKHDKMVNRGILIESVHLTRYIAIFSQ